MEVLPDENKAEGSENKFHDKYPVRSDLCVVLNQLEFSSCNRKLTILGFYVTS